MDINFFTTLKTILDAGSFQNAANVLGFTQSTISFQVRQLEQELNIQLFEKIGRKMILTQAGRDILPYVDDILNSVQHIKSFGKNSEELTGELRIAMPETLLVYKMQPVLKAFKKHAPDVRLTLHSYNCYKTNNAVINGDVDIGFLYDVDDRSDCVVEEHLEEITLTMIAPGDLPDEKLRQIPTNMSLIVSNDPDDACRVIVTDYLKSAGIHMQNVTELGSIEAIRRSVINGLGIAYLASHIVEEELEAGILKEVCSDITRKPVVIEYAIHKNKWVSPSMKLFIRLAKAAGEEQ